MERVRPLIEYNNIMFYLRAVRVRACVRTRSVHVRVVRVCDVFRQVSLQDDTTDYAVRCCFVQNPCWTMAYENSKEKLFKVNVPSYKIYALCSPCSLLLLRLRLIIVRISYLNEQSSCDCAYTNKLLRNI